MKVILPNDKASGSTMRTSSSDPPRTNPPDSLERGLELKSADSSQLAQWRKSERDRLIKQRVALSSRERRHMDRKIGEGLHKILGNVHKTVISLYFPFRGEPNLFKWIHSIIGRGACVAFPVVIGKDHPLKFKTWQLGDKLKRGVWNIPVPIHGPNVTPSVVIIPLVGFDDSLFRLGYGGGFFDRTLAAFHVKPLTIGVGYEMSRLSTIYPQPYDIPMDIVVTEDRIYR